MAKKPTYEELEQKIKKLEQKAAEREQAEKTIQKSDKYLKTLFENIQAAVVVHGPDTRILKCNKASQELLGLTEDQMLGKKAIDPLWKFFNEDGSDMPLKRYPANQVIATKNVLKDVIIGIYRPNKNDVVNVLVNAVPKIDHDGNISQVIVTFMDITERKLMEEALWESEEKYSRLFHRSNDGIFIHDLDGNIIDANQKILELLGYTKSEISSVKVPMLHPAEVLKKSKSAFETIIREGFVNFEIEFNKKSGEVFSAEVSSSLFEIGGKKVIQGIVRDITKRKQIEEELLKSKKLESISFLAGGIAHDFNNLLSVIMGNIELAEDDIKHEFGVSELLRDAGKAALQANELTKKLITFSKGGEPVKEVSSIGDLIKETTNSLVFGSNVRCEFFIPHDLYLIELDEDQMQHAVKNLIDNAIESMSDGGSINVQAENFEINSETEKPSLPISEGKYVKISIRDKGVGIPEEHLSMVFDPYFSTKEMGTQKGMGLGLATTYSIINRHGGHITVESEVGIGSIFTLYLPAYEKDIRRLESVDIATPEELKIRTPRILVMDDEEMIRNLAKQILKRLGYETELAKDGNEAIKLYKKAMNAGKRFDMVILDLTVQGGMGGKDAVKKILKIDPQVRAIVSSGHSTDPVMTNFRKYGFIDILPKPYTVKDMSEALNKVSAK